MVIQSLVKLAGLINYKETLLNSYQSAVQGLCPGNLSESGLKMVDEE